MEVEAFSKDMIIIYGNCCTFFNSKENLLNINLKLCSNKKKLFQTILSRKQSQHLGKFSKNSMLLYIYELFHVMTLCHTLQLLYQAKTAGAIFFT